MFVRAQDIKLCFMLKSTQIYLLITHLMKVRHTQCVNKTQRIVINSCAGDNSKSEPPDPFPNSEVKPLRADGSVAFAM